MRYAALATACCTAVLVAGCTGGSGPSGATGERPTGSPASQSSAASPADAGTPSAPGGLATGIQYADPDGSYRILTGPAWVSVPATGKAKKDHTEGWQLGPAETGFSPYVSISAAPSEAQDLTALMKSSAAAISKSTDTLLGAELVPGVSTGNKTSELGRLEFTTAGPIGGPAKLHLLVLISIKGSTAISAALVCPEGSYETYRRANEQYLRTLTAI